MQILEKNQDFKLTLPLSERDGDKQGSILTDASREQQGPQEPEFPVQLWEGADWCPSLHDHDSNHSKFSKANASMNFSSDFIKDLSAPSLGLICQRSLAPQGKIPNLLQPANSQSVALFPAREGVGQAWILTHNILKLSVVCP